MPFARNCDFWLVYTLGIRKILTLLCCNGIDSRLFQNRTIFPHKISHKVILHQFKLSPRVYSLTIDLFISYWFDLCDIQMRTRFVGQAQQKGYGIHFPCCFTKLHWKRNLHSLYYVSRMTDCSSVVFFKHHDFTNGGPPNGFLTLNHIQHMNII